MSCTGKCRSTPGTGCVCGGAVREDALTELTRITESFGGYAIEALADPREVDLIEQCQALLDPPTAGSSAHAALRRMARALLIAHGDLAARRAGEYSPRTDFVRASGDVVCDWCTRPYREHPTPDPACPTLARVCDGRLFKL